MTMGEFGATQSARRRLSNKAAVVTGSTSGIGLGIAKALAANGANVLLNGFGDAASIERLRREIAMEANVEVDYDGADLSKPDLVQRMIETANAAFGQVDILVNNAGIQHVSPIEIFPPDKWDAIISLNLSAAFHAIRAVFAGMKERNFGRIINIASAHGLVASPFKAAYVAAKHGIIGLTKVTALDTAQEGITCNANLLGLRLYALGSRRRSTVKPSPTAFPVRRSFMTCC